MLKLSYKDFKTTILPELYEIWVTILEMKYWKSQQRNRSYNKRPNGNFIIEKYDTWNKTFIGWAQWQNGDDRRISKGEHKSVGITYTCYISTILKPKKKKNTGHIFLKTAMQTKKFILLYN